MRKQLCILLLVGLIFINCSQFAFGGPANFLVGVRTLPFGFRNEPFKISRYEVSGVFFYCQIDKIDEFQ